MVSLLNILTLFNAQPMNIVAVPKRLLEIPTDKIQWVIHLLVLLDSLNLLLIPMASKSLQDRMPRSFMCGLYCTCGCVAMACTVCTVHVDV